MNKTLSRTGTQRTRAGLIVLLLAWTSGWAFPGWAASTGTAVPVRTSDLSFRLEVKHAIERGLAWLKTHQDPAGWWSMEDHPALTSLAVLAFQGDPRGHKAGQPWMEKAYAYLTANQKSDGGLHKGQLANYNTALSLLALLGAQKPEYEPMILKGRQYLVDSQIDLGEKGTLDTPYDGGVGYGSKYEHSDMANTLQALEALHYTRQLAEDRAALASKDLDWEAAIHFLQNCQNLPSHNKQSWASDDPQNKGGFVYHPSESKAGMTTNAVTGRVALRSYGSISYAGLLSYIYARMDREDPRVTAVLDWLKNSYTLEENPGLGAQGLFYYYHTMAKALTASGTRELKLPDGRVIPWRRDLAMRLINLQKADGSWLNEGHGRWWERDPVLVTAYAVLALEMVHRGL